MYCCVVSWSSGRHDHLQRMLKGSEKYQPDHVNVLLRLIDFLTVRKNNLAAALTKHTGACCHRAWSHMQCCFTSSC